MKFIKRFTVVIFIVLTIILGLQIDNPSRGSESNVVKSKSNALTVWYEQTFWESSLVRGIRAVRRRFEATARTPITTVVYENKKHLASWSNSIDEPFQIQYEEVKKYGHNISESVKGKTTNFEAEVKYTITEEKTIKINTTLMIAPGKRVVINQYDVRIKYHYVDVKVTKQQLAFTKYKDTNEWWWDDGVIIEYSGNHIDVAYF